MPVEREDWDTFPVSADVERLHPRQEPAKSWWTWLKPSGAPRFARGVQVDWVDGTPTVIGEAVLRPFPGGPVPGKG